MTILLDFNQISLAAIAQERATNHQMPIEEGLIKHFILNSIRANYKKFKNQYGEMIITCDSRSWRKSHLPEYKANRKKQTDSDWELIFKSMNEVREILEEYSPFKVIKVDGAEADDIIAWYCNHNGVDKKDEIFDGIGTSVDDILIISGDKDFQQLQKYKNVYQFSPTLKTYIKCANPKEFQLEQFARGDNSDGVPNVLSPDKSFINNIRQKPITSKFLKSFIEEFPTPSAPKNFSQTELDRNLQRNIKMIDLIDSIPNDVQESIKSEFGKPNNGSLNQLLRIFIELRMKNLMDNINDFR